jgi:hypothetical protein
VSVGLKGRLDAANNHDSAKVSKGEILVHFNEIFDALSKVGRPNDFTREYSLIPWNIAIERFRDVCQERR